LSLAGVRNTGSPRALRSGEQVEDFEQEIVDQYALAMAAAGLSDGHVGHTRSIVIEFTRSLSGPLWSTICDDADRFLAEPRRIREAAAMWFETDETAIELVPRPVLPKATGRSVEQARKAREQARDADRVAIEQTRKAAIALTSRGISIRDAAAILGISHQRVHQLLTPETPPRRKAG
jgi:hypothetical protein